MKNKVVHNILEANEHYVAHTKGTLNSMTSFIIGAVSDAARFQATGLMPKTPKKKINRGLLEVYFCLTNKRLMVFETTWYGAPKNLWSSIDLSEIEDVKLTFTKAFWKLPNVKIQPKEGKKIAFWSAKVHKKKTLHLIEEMQRLINDH